MSDTHKHSPGKNIKTAFFLNFSFTLIEFIGGLLTNSTAILADAAHDLGDTFALGQAWYFENLTTKKGSQKYSYGFKRFSLLGALISTVLLLTSSLFILSEAIPRLIDPQHSNAQGMVFLAVVGVIVNAYAMFKLDRNNSHASANIKVVALHLLEDVLGWVAILVVAIILLFKDIHILDPILAILITLYILHGVQKNIKQIIPIFLQATPENINIDTLKTELESIDNVISSHHVHAWSLDGQHNVLTAHLIVSENLNKDQLFVLKERARKTIEKFDFFHSTLELELPDEVCRVMVDNNCY